MATGDEKAAGQLYEVIYDELHRIARAHMGRQVDAHTLQATALVNEAWLRLRPAEGRGWEGREHFLSVASRAMRCILVDHVRRRRTDKRGGERERVPLDAIADEHEERAGDLVAFGDALSRLADLDERQARVIEMRVFGGLEVKEIATALDVSLATAERALRTARAWMRAELED